jgi:uncharacterized membrane protein
MLPARRGRRLRGGWLAYPLDVDRATRSDAGPVPRSSASSSGAARRLHLPRRQLGLPPPELDPQRRQPGPQPSRLGSQLRRPGSQLRRLGAQLRRLGAQLRRLGAQLRRLGPHLPVLVLIAAYALWFGWLSVQVQDGYSTPGFDMGIFDQGIWLLSHFHAPFVTVMGRDLFGDHTSFILLLAVPLYWVWPHPQTLLVLQAVLLAAAAVPVYLLALRRTASVWIATALAGAYLLNPALQNGNLEQFHPECFLALTVAVAIYAAIESKPVLLAVAVALSLLVKEDTALLIIPLGVWVYFRRDRRWGFRIIVAAVAWMVFAYTVVIESLLGTMTFYANRIPFGGLGGVVVTVVAHPLRFWRYFRSQGRLFYLWQMGIPFGMVFLIAPEVAAIGILTVGENVLSNFGYMHEILYHYSLPLVPVLALGTVFAVSRLATPGRRYLATGLVVVTAFVSCVLWGLAPFSRNVYPHANPSSPQVHAINSVLKLVPPDAVVSAYWPYVAHLDHRTRIYQWPTPFAAQFWALYTQEGQRLPFASQVQYVVIPVFADLTASDRAVLSSIANQYRAIGEGGGVVVYRRIGG